MKFEVRISYTGGDEAHPTTGQAKNLSQLSALPARFDFGGADRLRAMDRFLQQPLRLFSRVAASLSL